MRLSNVRKNTQNVFDRKGQVDVGIGITSLHQTLDGFILRNEFLLHGPPDNLLIENRERTS